MDSPHSVNDLSEGVGLLKSLTPAQLQDAITFLRELHAPGMRFMDGQLLYSAAFLGGAVEGQEVLPL